MDNSSSKLADFLYSILHDLTIINELKNLELQKKESNVIDIKAKKKIKRKPIKKRRFYKKAK